MSDGVITLVKLRLGQDPVHKIFMKDAVRHQVAHQDHITYIMVTQIHILKTGKIIPDKFLHQLIIMDGRFFKFLQTFPDPDASHFQGLVHNQLALVKE